MVKSADRTILILEAIAKRNEGATHGDLCEMLRIPKSSLSSLLANLHNRDYLSLDRRNKRYTLGPKILFLAGSYLSSTDIVQLGRPVIDKLMAQTEESAGLTIKKGHEILTVYNKNSPLPIIRSLQIGDRAPIYATAAGRVILAYLSDAEIDQSKPSATRVSLTAVKNFMKVQWPWPQRFSTCTACRLPRFTWSRRARA